MSKAKTSPHPDNTFTSSGTAKLELAPSGQRESKLYFSPAKDHIVEHLCEKYAVFVSDSSSDTLNAKAVKLKNNTVEIVVDQEPSAPWHQHLALAAIKSVGVDISVTFDKSDDSRLLLLSAVLPAQSHTE